MTNRTIRVLHIIKSLGRGGAEMLLPESLKLHNKNQFEFHCIYFLPWKNQLVEAIESAGGKVTCLNASNNLAILLQVKRIARYIREHHIDVVHTHLPWAGFVGRLVHRQVGIPVVYTEHNKQERYHWLTRVLNRYSFNWQTCAIAVSNDVASSIKSNLHLQIPLETILNGVNPNEFIRDVDAGLRLRRTLGIPEGSFVVGTVAVFRFQKRLKEWLEVFKDASNNNPNLIGLIVGDGPLKQEIIEHRTKLGLHQLVFMPGLQVEVRPYLSAMDVYMMTSEFEGLPVAMLEAMSMECAIVSTDAGGIKEVVEHNVNGLLEPVDHWQNLTSHLIALSQDTNRLKTLRGAARSRVIEQFSIARMVKSLESLYQRLLDKATEHS